MDKKNLILREAERLFSEKGYYGLGLTELLTACDISKTTTCPLARVMRRELRARGIEHLRVVYSTEPPRTPKNRTAAPAPGQPRPKDTPGSSPWVPSSAGLLIASEVIARLLGEAEW